MSVRWRLVGWPSQVAARSLGLCLSALLGIQHAKIFLRNLSIICHKMYDKSARYMQKVDWFQCSIANLRAS